MQRGTPEEAELSSAGLDAVDAAVQSYIDKGALAGALLLVARHGCIARVSTLGADDIATGAPLGEDSIFRIFSMTKPITGTAMMMLHDDGLWHPDDAIAKHLPELADVQVLNEDGSLVAPARAPTMLDLMTHRAGFAYGINIGEPSDKVEALYREAKILSSDDLDDLVGRLGRLPLAYHPGAKWRYSLAMEVQGAIVERLSGLSLPEFMRTRIFEPLGMVDTAFHIPPEKRHRLAKLYLKMGRGTADRDRQSVARGAGRSTQAGAGRRRAVLDDRRLCPLRADAAERRRTGRGAHRQRGRGARADDQPPARGNAGGGFCRRTPEIPARLRLWL